MYRQKLCLGLLGGVPAAEQISMLRDAGFDGFFSGWVRNADILALKKKGEQAGMLYQSVHAPFTHVDELWYPRMAGARRRAPACFPYPLPAIRLRCTR